MSMAALLSAILSALAPVLEAVLPIFLDRAAKPDKVHYYGSNPRRRRDVHDHIDRVRSEDHQGSGRPDGADGTGDGEGGGGG